MSFAFQNAESVKQALFEELQNLLSSESCVRKLAELRMKQLQFTEGLFVIDINASQNGVIDVLFLRLRRLSFRVDYEPVS